MKQSIKIIVTAIMSDTALMNLFEIGEIKHLLKKNSHRKF